MLRAFQGLLAFPSSWFGGREERQYEQGLAALTEALAAIALADAPYAKKQTERAARLLRGAPVTHLLSAQLARLEGNEPETRRQLEELLRDPQTEFAATRGLLETARRKGDWSAVASLGERALALRPKDRWSTLSLASAYFQQSRWQEMLGLLEAEAQITAAPSARECCVACCALAHYLHGSALYTQGQYGPAEHSVQYAVRRLGGFPPAITLLARLQMRRGDATGVMKTLLRHWKTAPHPDLADAFLDLVRAEKDSERIMQAAQRLVAPAAEHPESLLLLARASMAARQNTKARRILLELAEHARLPRVYRLLAELDAGNQEATAQWLEKAQNTQDYTWQCASCGHR